MLVHRAAFVSAALVVAFAACGGGSQNNTGSTTGSGATGGATSTTGGMTTSSTTGTSMSTSSTTSGGGGSGVWDDVPQVVNGPPPGTVLTAPKVQMIAYTEDPTATDIEKQLTELTHTQTWSQQTSEYGVGPLTVLPTIFIPGTPPATIDDNSGDPTPLQKTLAANTSGASPAWGAADASTIYMFLLPDGTQVNSGGLCCDPQAGYFGYHDEAPVGSMNVPYAVICNCPAFAMPPLNALDDVTTTVTHELAEASTDPFPETNLAYGQEDLPHIIWAIGTFGGEVADMCQDNTDSNYTPPGSTYMVQRSWSNAAARAGKNPCVPVPTSYPTYFNSYPVLPDMVTLDGQGLGQSITTEGVKIAVGQSQTIDIVLHSEAPTSGPWNVQVTDLSYFVGDTANPVLDLTLDKDTGSDGDVLHLTIKVLSTDSQLGGEGFVLSSTLGAQQNLWFAAVGQK